ncbi:DNA-directed RNA polymerase subunit RPC12/RpoP [Streptosporangium lutulentum]|uniref:DNA-directed RNA polymerase subunit RPC12/RpoP n=1 Tax=Streptosporangium lutulentum TaxID=1461250 RepID=A0ABT9QLV8_9ACTN|nr:DNA-directed RNA polymerase subunit RPC12/RpoP [Streptosporangium lutulentum]
MPVAFRRLAFDLGVGVPRRCIHDYRRFPGPRRGSGGPGTVATTLRARSPPPPAGGSTAREVGCARVRERGCGQDHRFVMVSAMKREPGTDPDRHRDPGRWLAQFAGRILVVCPQCGGRAVVVPRPGLPELKYFSELLFRPRRLTCGECGAIAEWASELRGGGLVGAALGGTEDPFFRRPLWLQTRCAGQILWAYNEEHVNELAAYVDARLRERGVARPTMAMFARLPRWMKTSGNRSDVLAGLERLRVLARRSASADRSDVAHERGDRPRPHGSVFFRGGPY